MSTVSSTFIRIPLPDGRRVAARLWRPVDGPATPAILEFRPYRGYDMFRALEDQFLPAWASAGYAVLAVDIAGSGQASGLLDDEYLPREIEDAVDAIAWCAGQAWCDGQVGLSGMSWSAFTALRVSARRPAALKALVLGGVSEDGWQTDIHNLGGAPYAARVDWSGVMLALNALPPDPAEFGEGWRDEWLARLAANRPWIATWLSHPARDAYWTDKAFDPDAAPNLPLLLYAGWADKYATSVLRIAEAWPGPVRTIVGPWEHTVPDLARRRPRIDFLGEALRWWDRWLKGLETGAEQEAPLRAWVGVPDRAGLAETGRWVASAWPVAAPNALTLALSAPGRLRPISDPARMDGVLRLSPAPETPAALGVDRYEDVPGPFDLEAAKRRGAVIALGDPITEDVELLGAPSLTGRVRSDRRGGLIVVRLLDIDPEGGAVRMTTGALDLAFRGDPAAPVPPKPGEAVDLRIDLQAAAWRLSRGHRLGLVVTADGWPTLWPDPSGATLEIEADSLILTVPRVETVGPTPVFSEPTRTARAEVAALKWIDPEAEPLPAASLVGAAAYDSRGAAHHLPATGTDYFSASLFELALADDGRQAIAAKVSRMAFQRPDWSIRVETRLVMRSMIDGFEIRWEVRAEHDGAAVYDVEDRTVVPRG